MKTAFGFCSMNGCGLKYFRAASAAHIPDLGTMAAARAAAPQRSASRRVGLM
jgi:hypothetical protein